MGCDVSDMTAYLCIIYKNALVGSQKFYVGYFAKCLQFREKYVIILLA